MLNLNIRDDLNPTIKQLLTDFRRVQVSRFPIIAEQHADSNAVKFIDSRYPTDTWRRDRVLAWLNMETDKRGRSILRLYSRLIENNKYSETSDGYRIRETADPKKMLGYIRQYVLPFTPVELMEKMGEPRQEYEQWVDQPRVEFYSVTNRVRGEVLAKEIMYLQTLGVQFSTNEFRDVAARGVELYGEMERRRTNKMLMVMVMVQPDQSVMLAWPERGNVEAGSRIYESMEMCPEHVQQQVAMLKMCDPSSYIPEVGKMRNPHTYWVHVNPNEFNFSNA